MIRRFYIMPLDHGVSDDKVEEFRQSFDNADLFIDGLHDAACGVDLNSRTVVWENNFDSEENYTGPYMLHPYHAQSLDNYIVFESPECISHDIYTARYIIPDGTAQTLQKGIRRVMLLHIEEGSDTSAIENFDHAAAGMATSVFSPENVTYVSPKGRSCTHVWDQGFTDMAALEVFLSSPVGLETTSREGLRRLGVEVQRITIFTYPFELKGRQTPPPLGDASPIFYSVTARLDPKDVDAFIASIEQDYDPFLAAHGTKLVHRWRSVDSAGVLADVQSVWQLDSFAVFNQWRMTYNPRSDQFVRNAMALVKGGQRRFYR